MRLVVLFSLASGALMDVAMSNLHSHDLRVFSLLWEVLRAGDIVLGDRGFGDYLTLARLPRQGVDVVARLHQRRKVDFRRAKRLGRNDGLFVWRKGYQQSDIVSAAQWRALPEEITVRIVRFHATLRGFRQRKITLVTTLLDPATYPAEALAALYARRWRLELCLRDVKTTMGMELLRCQSPAMARKEVPLGRGRSARGPAAHAILPALPLLPGPDDPPSPWAGYGATSRGDRGREGHLQDRA
jgi:hypothetical protein